MDPVPKSETVTAAESSAAFNEPFPATLIVTILFAFLFCIYVLTAPFAIDPQGFSLRIYAPVYWAATQRPFSAVLQPYFKLCGIEFGYGDEDPPAETYE